MMDDESMKEKQEFSYIAPWQVYGMGWSVRPDRPYRLAVGSFEDKGSNYVQVVQLNPQGEFELQGEMEHRYPATKVMWIPDTVGDSPDLVASSSDSLRIWQMDPLGLNPVLKNTFSDSKSATVDCCAPLTSFDWNAVDKDILGTASIDSICTIWSVSTGKPRTRLIAHDKEVFDIAFSQSTNIFATVGADGSVRMFDLRSLAHSTIIYESQNLVPLLRVAWNKQDGNYIAAFQSDSNSVAILDIRAPCIPVTELVGHTQPVNALSWAPHSSCHIITGAEDRSALIWDLSTLQKTTDTPILHYEADGEIDALQWSSLQNEWIAAAIGNKVQLLRV